MMKYLLGVFFLVFSILAMGQKGEVRGTVIDNGTGEPLIGVNIVATGTTQGTMTDLDGQFSLALEPGTYVLQVSYIAYQTANITGVQVRAGEVNALGVMRLKESFMELDEVVIKSEAVRNSEAALISVKKKSAAIMDGISASAMKMIGGGTAVEASKRVTGVSVEDGKYVYIRGLGDRYTKTTFNGVQIPGLDPDKNSLQLDIFPSSLIDNITVSKNFSAELPADFTGGILNIETKAFPEQRIFDISVGLGYNPSMHFNPDYLTYKGGNLDWLGMDDGTRALPQGARSSRIPTPVSGASSQEVHNFVRSFNPQLGAQRQMSLMDYSLGLTYGNQLSLGQNGGRFANKKLGYIFSVSYKVDYQFYDDVVYGEYQRYIDPQRTEMRYANLITGEMGEKSVLVGTMAGVAYKTQYSKYKLLATRLQSGISRAGKFHINNSPDAVGQSGFFAESDNLEYNERSLTNLLLNGNHVFDQSGWEIDWKLSPTWSVSDDPDIRKTAFTQRPTDTIFNAGAGGNPSRIWRSLDEINLTGKVDLSKKYRLGGTDAKLMFGASHLYKQRDYEILLFDLQFFGSQRWPDPRPSVVLNQEYIYPNSPNRAYYQSGNNNPNPNAYSSNAHNAAAYVSNEFAPFSRLRAIFGLRAEYFVQRHTGRDQTYASGDHVNGSNLENDIVLQSVDLFPSANFIYALTEDQNLRLTYGRSIARPSFKELSYAQILDPITNRIFNGSLFTYSDWQGNLTETRIDNLDLRWELFLERNEMISVSSFYKRFDNPIELVRIPEQQTSTEYQPRNVGDGQLYGIELELRKNLGFVAPSLEKLLVNTNITFVESRIDMTALEYNSRKSYEKPGESIQNKRQMAGQAPYVINAGLSYSDMESGLNAGLFYNVKGPTLYIVGAGLFPDIYNEPFHSLSFSFNKALGANTVVDFKITNILNDRLESFYRSYDAEPRPFSSLNPGMTFSFGVSFKL